MIESVIESNKPAPIDSGEPGPSEKVLLSMGAVVGECGGPRRRRERVRALRGNVGDQYRRMGALAPAGKSPKSPDVPRSAYLTPPIHM